MRRGARWVAAAITTAAALATVSPAATSAARTQQSPDSEIGITKDTIRIAVIADGDNPIRPGVFKGAIDGVNAGAKYILSLIHI